MAYEVNPRLTEAALLDRITGGGGINEYDQRQLARQGIIPTQQQLINGQLNDKRIQQEQLRQQKLQSQILKNQATYSGWPYVNYDQQRAGTPSPQIQQRQQQPATRQQRQPAPQQQQPQQKYSIDYQAAEDAGNFLRALQGKSGRANERTQGQPDLQRARELLNKTPYSSINNATDLQLNDNVLSIMGPDNTVIGKIPMPDLERQLSNLNNYAIQKNLVSLPAQAARLDSKELGEGAAEARNAAMSPENLKLQGYKERRGLWQRPKIDPVTGRGQGFETFDPNKAGQKAYRDFINEYGARGTDQSTYQYDPNFNRSTTPARLDDGTLGFNLASRYSTNPMTGEDYSGRGRGGAGGGGAGGGGAGGAGGGADFRELARQLAGVNSPDTNTKPGELPGPESTIKPGEQGELPAPAGTQPTLEKESSFPKVKLRESGISAPIGKGVAKAGKAAVETGIKAYEAAKPHIENAQKYQEARRIALLNYNQPINDDQAEGMARYYQQNNQWPPTINDIPAVLPAPQQLPPPPLEPQQPTLEQQRQQTLERLGQNEVLLQEQMERELQLELQREQQQGQRYQPQQQPAAPQQQGIQYLPQQQGLPINDLTVEQNPQQQQQQQQLIDNLQRAYQQQRQQQVVPQPQPQPQQPQQQPPQQPIQQPQQPIQQPPPPQQGQQQIPAYMLPWQQQQQQQRQLNELDQFGGGAPAGPAAAPQPQQVGPAPAQIEYNPPEESLQAEPIDIATPDWNLIENDAQFGELGLFVNPDNQILSEFSITEFVPDIGGWVNIPTMVQGQTNLDFLSTGILTPENIEIAIKRAIDRTEQGAELPTYDSQAAAEEAARNRTEAEKMRPFQNSFDEAHQTLQKIELSADEIQILNRLTQYENQTGKQFTPADVQRAIQNLGIGTQEIYEKIIQYLNSNR